MNTTTASSARRGLTTKEMALCGMFAALLTVISQLSLPMPTGVPITIQMFGVALTGVVLGWKLGLCATLTYVLLGAVGLPVFANLRGGISSLVGVTGGYIWSWPIMTALCGIRPKTGDKQKDLFITIAFALLGLAISETIGGLQWAALAGDKSVAFVFSYAIVAFIPKDAVLTVLAVLVGIPMRRIVRS